MSGLLLHCIWPSKAIGDKQTFSIDAHRVFLIDCNSLRASDYDAVDKFSFRIGGDTYTRCGIDCSMLRKMLLTDNICDEVIKQKYYYTLKADILKITVSILIQTIIDIGYVY